MYGGSLGVTLAITIPDARVDTPDWKVTLPCNSSGQAPVHGLTWIHSAMSESGTHCHRCGATLELDQNNGLCLGCLLELTLREDETLSDPDSNDVEWFRHHPPAGPAPLFDAGARFGSYQLCGEVGRGGMGVIYKARHTQLNRTVALKMVMSGPLASPDFARRFQTEVRAAAGLEHPHIVPIYEVGETDGQQYYTMRLLEGGSLAEHLKEKGRVEPHMAAGWIQALASAVDYAHQRGVLHRDLKPANILLDDQNQPLITDFGLARLIEEESSLTLSQVALGTPSYMSPEQAGGQLKELTTASDIHSLGSILWELLTGRRLFDGATPLVTINAVIEREPAAPSTVCSGVPRDLDTICLKCLQKEPSRRYRSAQELAEDLGRWLRGEPIYARPVGAGERLMMWCRRRPALAALAGASLAVLLASTSIAAWRIGAARQQEELERYAAKVREASHAIQEGAVDRALDSLMQCQEELRHWEWGRLLYECLQEAATMPAFASRPKLLLRPLVRDMALNKDGSILMAQGDEGGISVWEPIEGKLLWRNDNTNNPVVASALSRDGSRVAISRLDGSVEIVDGRTGEMRMQWIAPQLDPPDPRLGPAAVMGLDVYEWEPGRNALYGRPFVVTGIAWNAEGSGLLAIHADGTLEFRGLEGAERIWRLSPPEITGVIQVSFAPVSGEVVILTSSSAQRRDPDTGRLLGSIQWDPDGVLGEGVAVSPEGDAVVRVMDSWHAILEREDGVLKDLGSLHLLSDNMPFKAFFSRDGRRFCTVGGVGGARVFDSIDGRALLTLDQAVYGGAFSPDGEQVSVY